jgi:hypothetical protein
MSLGTCKKHDIPWNDLWRCYKCDQEINEKYESESERRSARLEQALTNKEKARQCAG